MKNRTSSRRAIEYADYPALYRAADKLSNSAQRIYIWMFRAYLTLLVLLSLMSLPLPLRGAGLASTGAAVLFGLLATLTVVLAFSNLGKTWYSARALAESIKTLTWRFVMRAKPYNAPTKISKIEFLKDVRQVFNQNHDTVERMGPHALNEDQLSTGMMELRQKTLAERRTTYKEDRIEEQLEWYSLRTRQSTSRGNAWYVGLVLILITGLVVVIVRDQLPDWVSAVPGIAAAAAGSVLTWIQVKRFRDVAAAYSLTAHEIGFLKSTILDVDDEAHLSAFVSDAESAFSREHTQWAARRDK